MNEASLWPPTEMVDEAINRPSSRAPESPMKIFAGWKFHGRNPRHTPSVTTAMSGPMLPLNSAPDRSSLMPYNRNAPEAIAITPVASPSRPSIRLTALAITSTHITVTSAARSVDNTVKPMSGSGTLSIEIPASTRIEPENTMPATFAGADTSRMSSITPVRKITPAASTTPRMYTGVSNMARNCGSSDAQVTPATMPRNIAPPPSVGVGRSWILRSPGVAIAPKRSANRIMSGTIAAVTTAVTPRTSAYEPITPPS